MPDIVVETGAIVEGANSYITEDEFETYADNHGYDITPYTGDKVPQAIIRARTAIDATYGVRYPGYKIDGRSQALSWPRTEAYDLSEEEILEDEIPQEVKDAQAEATWEELKKPGALLPTLARGGGISAIRAGSVAINYSGSATNVTKFSKIEGILAPILAKKQAGFIVDAVRA